jgi:photosystem II stability/assembly factor-like uncharacterized protein
VGLSGTILGTTDGGATWTSQRAASGRGLSDVAFADADHGIAVGLGGTILLTNDGGATWQDASVPLPRDFQTVMLEASGAAIITGSAGTVLRWSDWHQPHSVASGGPP